ncbi:interleukin-7 receptor subunit alpha [Myripristis murdjan]|uniref:interleukin-7 receptor subunit alpha n=1 Tax=Myripristis murdjan TaxID=586833 RepID=UPI001175F19B|nr:interleukin-7 receptor subunit alpha [Myripristis murdjan]
MPLFSLWMVLLLVPAGTQAQSGDVDSDIEPRINCVSHISRTKGNSITCNLAAVETDGEDDEDDVGDDIKNMTVCVSKMIDNKFFCVGSIGNTVISMDLTPLTAPFTLTVQLKGGGKIMKTLDPRKIIKPKSPQVLNATFYPKADRAEILIKSPYHNDYLKAKDLLHQLHIWSPRDVMMRNITSEPLIIEGEHLQKNTEYHVKARTIPNSLFQGTWSEWSATLSFSTHIEPKDTPVLMYNLMAALVALFLVVWSIVFFWKKKIYTYMWPSIPHPKHTLVQMYKPIKGLPGTFNPETFGDLEIYPVDKIEEQHHGEAELNVAADDIPNSKDPCSSEESSGQTSDSSRSNTSVTTEESEVSTLLSQSSSGGEDDLQSRSPSPVGVLQPGQGQDRADPAHNTGKNYPEMYGVTQQGKDEAYVTMSSFYQIK